MGGGEDQQRLRPLIGRDARMSTYVPPSLIKSFTHKENGSPERYKKGKKNLPWFKGGGSHSSR